MSREVMQKALDAIGSAYREHFVNCHGSTKNELQAAANAIRAELAKPAAVPGGWVIVPREPTEEMCLAYERVSPPAPAIGGEDYKWDAWARAEYAAMLAAAPQPPTPAVDEGRHPLDCLHINRGSLDAAADAYEAEFDNAKCREAFDNRYHKIKAAVSYDEWQAIWFKALEHERRKTAPAVSPVDVEAVRDWKEGTPPHPYDKEWFIAVLDSGDKAVLTALPEDYSYDYKTADETYFMKYRIKKWMQFPDSEYRHPPPPDVRELVEAAEAVVRRWDSPLWSQQGHTGEFIARLRAALTKHREQS